MPKYPIAKACPCVILIEPPTNIEMQSSKNNEEEILRTLVHDLRQPLGTVETSIFCLDLMLEHPSGRVREQLCAMERQVAEATQLLEGAVEKLRSLRAQRFAEEGMTPSAVGAGNFVRTKSVTAGVK